MNILLVAAAVLSLVIFLLHIFGGGPPVIRQLIKPDGTKGEVGRMTAYYAWHLVTITLLAQAIAFWMAAGDAGAHDLALFASVGALAFTLWSLLMIAIHKLKPLLYPQWLLFLPVAIVGFLGLYW